VMVNRARDERVRRKLRSMGWSVITIWECSLSPNRSQATLSRLHKRLNSLIQKKEGRDEYVEAY
jgi:G:T-mismatch repair DNA endonuclease (very short patch repair protein)